MADLNLLESARALDDDEFRWRVTAASFQYASGFAGIPDGPERFFAFWQLLHPRDVDPSLLALVANWAPVAEAITVVDGVVDTSGVADQDIMDAVGQSWPLVANKYTANPLASLSTTTGA